MTYTIKQARRLCGKTQSEMAELLYISRGAYRRIEENPEVATVPLGRHIAKITGIPFDHIFLAQTLL